MNRRLIYVLVAVVVVTIALVWLVSVVFAEPGPAHSLGVI